MIIKKKQGALCTQLSPYDIIYIMCCSFMVEPQGKAYLNVVIITA